MTTATLKHQVLIGARLRTESETALWRMIHTWRSRGRQRRHLSLLTADQLMDVGITPEAALSETKKPFWRA